MYYKQYASEGNQCVVLYCIYKQNKTKHTFTTASIYDMWIPRLHVHVILYTSNVFLCDDRLEFRVTKSARVFYSRNTHWQSTITVQSGFTVKCCNCYAESIETMQSDGEERCNLQPTYMDRRPKPVSLIFRDLHGVNV